MNTRQQRIDHRVRVSKSIRVFLGGRHIPAQLVDSSTTGIGLQFPDDALDRIPWGELAAPFVAIDLGGATRYAQLVRVHRVKSQAGERLIFGWRFRS